MTTATSSADLDLEVLPGYYIEPSTGAWLTLPWPGDLSLPWGHPDRVALLPPSLGRQIRWWSSRWLLNHLSGDPWRWHPSQARFLELWYAVRGEDDLRWLWRSGVKRGAKGIGKDPMQAAMSMVELAGPTRYTGRFAAGGERADWDADYVYREGEPIGEPHRLPLVQIGANSEAQAKDVLRVANAMVSRAMQVEYLVDVGETRTQLDMGGRIELLTRSEKSTEGDPATALFLNETHHMTATSGGQALAAVARRNAAKSPGGIARVAEFTNSHMPGEGSVAEDSFDAWQAQVAGKTRRMDILYDSREAAPSLRMHIEEELEHGIAQAYADSPWSDQERMRDEAQDPRTSVADSVRYYFNALPTNEMAWIEPRAFDACANRDITVADGEAIALFLDCSKSSDATVLCGSRLSDGHVMALGGWQRPHGDRGTGWLAPREKVDARVRAVFDRWHVAWFGVDPSPAKDDETEALYWAKLIDQWHRDFHQVLDLWATPGAGGNAVLFDMRLSTKGAADRLRLFTEQAELTAQEIDEDQSLTHDGDPMLRLHAHNARRRPNRWGVSLSKQSRDSKKLVDMAVAMVGARLGRRLVLNRPIRDKPREKKPGKVW